MLDGADLDNKLAVVYLYDGNVLLDGSVGRVGGHNFHRSAAAGDVGEISENVLNDVSADRAFCIAEIILHNTNLLKIFCCINYTTVYFCCKALSGR